MTTNTKEIIAAIDNDLDRTHLMTSANCFQAMWTILKLENTELRAKLKSIVNSCSYGAI